MFATLVCCSALMVPGRLGYDLARTDGHIAARLHVTNRRLLNVATSARQRSVMKLCPPLLDLRRAERPVMGPGLGLQLVPDVLDLVGHLPFEPRVVRPGGRQQSRFGSIRDVADYVA